MGIPGDFAAYTAGTVDGNPGGCAACTAGDPDGTRTDNPQAADLHWAAHSTSPIASLRSSAVQRCDNYHGIVELDALRMFWAEGIPWAIARP
jgi:hypothetical protein